MRRILDRSRKVGLDAETVRRIQKEIYRGTDPSEIVLFTTKGSVDRWKTLAGYLGIEVRAISKSRATPRRGTGTIACAVHVAGRYVDGYDVCDRAVYSKLANEECAFYDETLDVPEWEPTETLEEIEALFREWFERYERTVVEEKGYE